MAIQISEHKLSPEAKKALNNAKNKSQFLRDAIEFYVRREEYIKKSDPEIKKELEEIKELIKQLSQKHITNEKHIANDEIAVGNIVNLNQKPTSNKIVKDINTERKNEDNLSEEQKRIIEKMLDNSLSIF